MSWIDENFPGGSWIPYAFYTMVFILLVILGLLAHYEITGSLS